MRRAWVATTALIACTLLLAVVVERASAGTTNIKGSNGEDPEGDKLFANGFRPLQPLTLCHRRLNQSHCLSVFGYRNANDHVLSVEVDSRWNYFLPRPFHRGQPSLFAASTTNGNNHSIDYATHVLWRCGGASLPRRMRSLVWTLRTAHPTRWVERQAGADRSAPWCSDKLTHAVVVADADGQQLAPAAMVELLMDTTWLLDGQIYHV